MIVVTVSQKQVTRRMFVMTVPHKQDEFVHNLKLLSFFDYDSDAVTMVFWCNLAKHRSVAIALAARHLLECTTRAVYHSPQRTEFVAVSYQHISDVPCVLQPSPSHSRRRCA